MQVKIKKLSPEAVIPKYETSGSVGMDLTATSKWLDEFGNVCFGTGLAIEIPKGYFADLAPRSSVSKCNLILANSIGKIDSDYRGELILKFKPIAYLFQGEEFSELSIDHPKDYDIGDRIAQIIILPYPKIEFVEVDELSNSERGNGGFGSTDAITKSIEDNFNV